MLENLRKDTARHVSEAPEQHKARRIPRPDTQAVATVQYHALCNQPLTWNVGKWLTISHHWLGGEGAPPDPTGDQLQAIRKYLLNHPKVEWVWFEYAHACAPATRPRPFST